MSAYTKAASFVLDTLWEDDDFRAYFHETNSDLADLGPLIFTVFEPVYLHFKESLDEHALAMLDAQVAADVLAPLLRNKQFSAMWVQWDDATREAFIQEQSELQLAELLVQVYLAQLDVAYREAFAQYLATHETMHRR